ncbi:membrane protein insertase YidC [Sphingomonas oleivorans]|uniref:Membrane protein insertase YidC n=1 Tax=Sphingomonas oleivorans TaxID=1735121 RepID=A0A2T5FV28_9SPHN|nr:membrane protein insertase YidC [Sphingomonas oleivorans]PTQ08586.1 membrane protein insertase YidC [Sphingomonas oleivorans]
MENQRNLILAIVLSALVLLGWTLLSDRFLPTANPPSTKVVDGKVVPLPQPEALPAAPTIRDRAVVIADTPRVRIETPRLAGSINLKGARIDDLVLSTYKETIAKDSKPVRLLSPGGAPDAYFTGFGWTGDGVTLPGPDTVWQASGDVLAPGKPVTLNWANGRGQRFQILLEVDPSYMFTVRQTVGNGGTGAIAVKPYALVSRVGHSKDPDSWTMHTGPIGTFNGSANYGINFKDLDEDPAGERFSTTGGWLGFGDKYWLTALIPDQRSTVDAGFRGGESQRYQADIASAATIIPAGKAVTTTTRFFAGAKEVALLDGYEKSLGISQLDKAIDWGWFYWFEKPIFYLLDWLFRMVGNFGVAIILLTCIVRGLMFPIAQKQFASMAAMRVVQPKMKALQEKYKDDKQRLQQEMLKLYQEEKVNPLAGCLPILLQIPIFYALYKVLMLTIEMRHQPFALWIKDLSAPDPLTPLNLFGLIDWAPPQFIAIGVLPILLGVTMYYQFKLNPQQMDPVQQQVFSIMPWIFMFIMAGYATGLVLYWCASNILTIAQQKWLYSRHPALKAAAPAAPK